MLVSDAAGNELIRVWPNGQAVTVARLKTRLVPVPDFMPATDPDTADPLPPPGTPLEAEGVATSVTVGADGYWYVGELRGFPATPGTSEIWRIKPGSVDAVCDPEHPWKGACKRFADGLTSIVDLGAGRHSIYARGAVEAELVRDRAGSARRRGRRAVQGQSVPPPALERELVKDQLIQPGGVDVGQRPYVVGPVFGPGALSTIS